MRSGIHSFALAALSLAGSTSAIALDVKNSASIKSAASTIAFDLMSYYKGNLTNDPSTVAVLGGKYYWWEAGAMWGAMLDYGYYTRDTSYDQVTTQALLSQVGPNHDYLVPAHLGDEGNDDQAFWGFNTMAAAERNYPMPKTIAGGYSSGGRSWLQLTENLWNNVIARWDTTTCNGGLRWQIQASRVTSGYNYKNTVSNGAMFQLSARLAKVTGNQTYIDWANKIYDWTSAIGFISASYDVYDGAGNAGTDECKKIDRTTWSYNHGIVLYGSAVMYNLTGSAVWQTRTQKFLDASAKFFATGGIMAEIACESVRTCNTDQFSFKAYLSRFMWYTTKVAPFTGPQIQTYLTTTAAAVAKICTGGSDGHQCGYQWTTGTFDNSLGVGQQLSALETIQGLVSIKASQRRIKT